MKECFLEGCMPTGKKKKVIVEQYHAVCNECGGRGCDICHAGWQCTMEDIGKCNKCAMDWPLGKNDD